MQKEIVAFKNNAPFIKCISKINGIQIDNTEDLDVVMPMYNLLEYSKNYRKTTGSLWNFYRGEQSNTLSTDSESFEYKTSITGNTYMFLQQLLMMKTIKFQILNMRQTKLVNTKLKLLLHQDI